MCLLSTCRSAPARGSSYCEGHAWLDPSVDPLDSAVTEVTDAIRKRWDDLVERRAGKRYRLHRARAIRIARPVALAWDVPTGEVLAGARDRLCSELDLVALSVE